MNFKRLIWRVPLHLILLAFTAVWLVPTLGLLITSFRSPENIFGSGWWTVFADLFNVDQYTFENYMQVIDKQGLWRSFCNSLIISVPSTLISTFLGAMVAFGFAWMKFAGRNILFLLVNACNEIAPSLELLAMTREGNQSPNSKPAQADLHLFYLYLL